MASEFSVRPVQVADERLKCIQFPEEVLRSWTAVPICKKHIKDPIAYLPSPKNASQVVSFILKLPFDFPFLLLETFVNGLCDGGFHQINVADHLWRKCIAEMLMEPPVLQIIWWQNFNISFGGCPQMARAPPHTAHSWIQALIRTLFRVLIQSSVNVFSIFL